MEIVDAFSVGKLYSNSEIYHSLSVGNAGGVRAKVDAFGCVQRLVIMTSVASARQLSENPYHDRLEGDVLAYTGAGRAGNQTVSGPNARIVEQLENRFPIYGFILLESRRNRSVGNRRWAFLGLLECLRFFQERQLDAAKTLRTVCIFELRVHSSLSVVNINAENLAMEEIFANRQQASMTDDQDVLNTTAIPNDDFSDFAEMEAVRRQLLCVHPRKFETIIEHLLIQSGFEQVQVTKYSQDGGIDVNARPGRLSWPIRHLLVQFQAKRWIHTVGRKEIAELRGSLQPYASGCVVTTSHFSRAALKEATDSGKAPISLIDGLELAKVVKTLNLSLD